MVSIVLLNGGNPYDHHEFSDLYDLPEVRFYTDMANNINYKERKRSVIAEDTAEVCQIMYLRFCDLYLVLIFIFLVNGNGYSLYERKQQPLFRRCQNKFLE